MSALFATLLSCPSVHADTPSVTGLAMAPQNLGNDLSGALTWSGSNSSGYDVLFTCGTGVTISMNGSAATCGTRTALSAGLSNASIAVTNVSGATQHITATVYPKDSGGTDYDAGAQSTNFYVTTSPQPLITFTTSTTTPVTPGGTITFTWTGVDTPGVNLQFTCPANITLFGTSPSTTSALPCNQVAFSPALSQSGSATIQAFNNGITQTTINVAAVPEITTDMYDMTHALSTTFVVGPKVATPAPLATSFSASPQTAVSDQPITLNWTTANTGGANVQMQCGDHLKVSLIDGATTTPLYCPGLLSPSQALAASGSTTISVSNTGTFAENLVLNLMPQGADGSYLAPSGIVSQITIMPKGYIAPTNAGVPTTLTTAPATAATSTQTASSTPAHNTYHFTKYLTRGSKGAAVTALQTYLAQDSSLYPEGLVTGFYGAATAAAVGRFQLKYGITTASDQAFGSVGPKTRAKLNSL